MPDDGLKTTDKRIALVTGASRGIGAAVAKKLAEQRCHVLLLARTVSALEAVYDSISAQGGTATIMPADLSDLDSLDTLGPTIFERFGGLDVFVSNAGILGQLSPVGHIDPKEWRRVMDINLNAQHRLIRTLDPLLQKAEAGRAVFISSGIGNSVFFPFWGGYAATKAALKALVLTYANENPEKPIKINVVRPGVIDTDLIKKAFPGGMPDHLKARLKKPDDVAEGIAGLCSPESTVHAEFVDLYEE